MADQGTPFRYSALDATGRRIRGTMRALDEHSAFERLRHQGLAPLELKSLPQQLTSSSGRLSDVDAAELLGSLADLLSAGADMRTSLEILGARASKPLVADLCRALIGEIGRGDALEEAFGRHLAKRQAFVAAMIAAGEASGDLSGALRRASEMASARVRLRSKLVSILAYPTFVLISSIGAVIALLMFVVPTIAPLTADGGGSPPMLRALIWLSDGLRANLLFLLIGAVAGCVLLWLASRTGVGRRLADQFILDGPPREVMRPLVFGGFTISLGGMLSAGAPVSESLRLAIRSTASPVARERLEAASTAVRQGQPLSVALEQVRGFPAGIARLVAVGEATGALGQMLTRGGELEEASATKRLEAIGQLLGPALIIALGGLVGLMMASLLSGIGQIGEAALG